MAQPSQSKSNRPKMASSQPPSSSFSSSSSSPSPSSSDVPITNQGRRISPKQNLQEAENELSTSIRVRNRLASSDDVSLPRILTALLPRVLSKLGKNASRMAHLRKGRVSVALYESTEEEEAVVVGGSVIDAASVVQDASDSVALSLVAAEWKARRGIYAALRGIVRHAEERVRGNPCVDAPWVGPVAEFLSSVSSLLLPSSSSSSSSTFACVAAEGQVPPDDEDDEADEESDRKGYIVSIRAALGLLGVGLVRCHNCFFHRPAASLPSSDSPNELELRVRIVLVASLSTVKALFYLRRCRRRAITAESEASFVLRTNRNRLPRRPGQRPRPGQAPAPRPPRHEDEEETWNDGVGHGRVRGWGFDQGEVDDNDGSDDDGDNDGDGGNNFEEDAPWSDASWLAFDCVAILTGIRPLDDRFEIGAPLASSFVRPGSSSDAFHVGGVKSDPPLLNSQEGDATNANVPLVRAEEVRAAREGGGGGDGGGGGESGRNGNNAGGGDGIFDLFLDLVLYWPGRGACCGGMSPEGTLRMNRRIDRLISSDLGIGDLVELKLAALRYAAWPPGRGLFESLRGESGADDDDNNGVNDDGVGASRAVLLLILACGHPVGRNAGGGAGGKHGADESVHRAKLGRVAGGRLVRYLDRYHVGKSALPVSAVLRSFGVSTEDIVAKKKKKKSKTTKSMATKKGLSSERRPGPRLGIGLAYSLLVLVLGEVRAAQILAGYPRLERLWSDVLGPLSSSPSRVRGDGSDVGGTGGAGAEGTFFARVPLNGKTAAAALDFVTKHFLEETKSEAFGGGGGGGGGSSSGGRIDERRSGEEIELLMFLALQTAELALRAGIDDDDARRAHVMQHGWGMLPDAGAGALRAVCAASAEGGGDGGGGGGGLVPKWRREARARCLSIAMGALSTVPAATEDDAPLDDVDGLQRNVFPELMPHGLRGRIAAQIRARRARNVLLLPRGIRKATYEVMGSLASDLIVYSPRTSSDGSLSPSLQAGFSLQAAVLLFRCVVMEEETTRPDVAAALDSHLRATQSYLRTYLSKEIDSPMALLRDNEDSLNALAAPILPPLLSASCSESRIARLSAARWASGVLSILDPFAACHLCSYLADDPDVHISQAAARFIGEIVSPGTMPEGKRRKTSSAINATGRHGKWQMQNGQKAVVLFLDSDGGMDRQVLYAKLDHEINDLARCLGIGESAASVVLRCYHYSKERALDAFQSNPSGTLEHCGVEHRCKASAVARECSFDGSAHAGQVCGICFEEDLPADVLYSMPCGHHFCLECWTSYLNVAFEGTILDTVCPQDGCSERVTDAEIIDLIPSMLETWRNRRFAAFIERNARHRFCPGPNCTMIAVCDSDISAAVPIAASCDRCQTCFCFGCGESPHLPANCDTVRRWKGIFESSEFWVRKNSKPCPRCAVPIEKNHGCNHIHCTRCDCHFCWICLTVIGADGILNRHVCNRYDPSSQGGEQGRNVFYVTRYEAHDQAEGFARQLRTSMLSKIESLSEEPLLLSSEESVTLKRATEMLEESRRFLKFSYVFAFCAPDESSPKASIDGLDGESLHVPASSRQLSKEAFVTHQGTLERFTEKLSALTEVDLENLLDLKGERVLRGHLRAIDFHTQCVANYMGRIVLLIDNA